MTKLDELMLTGKWLDAIRHVRKHVVLCDTRNVLALNRAILLCAWRAYQIGILDGAPSAFRRRVIDHDIAV